MTLLDLKACRRYRGEIESLMERIVRLRSQAERLSRPLSSEPSGGAPVDFLPEYAAKLDELERELMQREVDYQAHLDHVERWLRTLPEQQAKVVRLRYVEGLRWDGVAGRAHYCEQHCRRIRNVALKKLARK